LPSVSNDDKRAYTKENSIEKRIEQQNRNETPLKEGNTKSSNKVLTVQISTPQVVFFNYMNKKLN
jgi:hypothetical protein